MRRAFCFLALALLLSCGRVYAASTNPDTPLQFVGDPGRTPPLATGARAGYEPAAVPPEPIDLKLGDALALALSASPELSAYSKEVRAAEAEIGRASCRERVFRAV